MRDEVWNVLKENAKLNHDVRVSKTPKRIEYAIKQLKKHDIKYSLKNNLTGHFHCFRKLDNKLFQFYAGTGKIQGYENKRGIHALIKMLR